MSSFWDEFKDLFKTDSQLEEERQKEINDALGKESEVVEKLKELEKQYNDSLPKEEEVDIDTLFPKESPYKEIEYTAKSDDDIEAEAKKSVDYDKQSAINNVDEKYRQAIEALDGDKQSAKETLKQSYANLESLYKELREKANDDALKRGIARSSIAGGKLDALKAAHISGASDAEKAYSATIASINSDISKLERDKDNALGELDLKYAVELDERISALKDERDKTVAQYEKYNNDIREKNNKYESERQTKINDYLSSVEKQKKAKAEEQAKYESEYGYSGEKLDNYSQRYKLAYEFYSSLSPDIAVDALKASPNMKYYLGNNYNKLLSALYSREDSDKKYF